MMDDYRFRMMLLQHRLFMVWLGHAILRGEIALPKEPFGDSLRWVWKKSWV